MYIKIGAYELSTKKVFSSLEEALEFVIPHFPTVQESKIIEKVKPFIKKSSNVNQSRDTITENSGGKVQHATTSEGSSGKKPSGKNKH